MVAMENPSYNELELIELLYPYYLKKREAIKANNTRFVHYTTAATAFQIIKNEEVWMRKSSIMNDFMEVEHGLECLRCGFNTEHSKSVLQDLDGRFQGITNRIIEMFNDWTPHFQTDTYLACISEHNPDEDVTGRLSMWRAYGGRNGVAIVMNNKPFFAESEIGAFTAPVSYLSLHEFIEEFELIMTNLRNNIDRISMFSEDQIFGLLFSILRFNALCTKHKGFHEEKEWRIIYSPKFESSKIITTNIEIISGVPQSVCKIPLHNVPEVNFVDVEVSQLVDRIIIGPTEFPGVTREAFVSILKDRGMSDSHKRVIISDIPLRN